MKFNFNLSGKRGTYRGFNVDEGPLWDNGDTEPVIIIPDTTNARQTSQTAQKLFGKKFTYN